MMESINELKRITQSEKREAQGGNYALLRDISIYITWMFLHTSISANQITCLSIVFGAAGAVLVGSPNPAWGILGCILVWCYLLLDKVDGEIARYRKTQSLRGIMLDELGHLILQPMLFIGLAWHVYRSTDQPLTLVLGVVAALLVGWSRVMQNLHYRIFSKKAVVQPIALAQPDDMKRHALAQRIEQTTKPLFKALRIFQHHYWVPTLVAVIYMLELLYPIGGVWSYYILIATSVTQVVSFCRAVVISFLSFEVLVLEVDQQVRQSIDHSSKG